jgi:hypothetical protein
MAQLVLYYYYYYYYYLLQLGVYPAAVDLTLTQKRKLDYNKRRNAKQISDNANPNIHTLLPQPVLTTACCAK